MKSHLDLYFEELCDALAKVQCSGVQGRVLDRAEAYERTLEIALEATERGGKLMFIGNGGSAGIASHMAIDFSKNGGMAAMCFNDAAALTCLGNDFGYEEVFAKQLQFHARRGDVLFAISSSGSSPNILRAVEVAHVDWLPGDHHHPLPADNPLRAQGEVNFHMELPTTASWKWRTRR